MFRRSINSHIVSRLIWVIALLLAVQPLIFTLAQESSTPDAVTAEPTSLPTLPPTDIPIAIPTLAETLPSASETPTEIPTPTEQSSETVETPTDVPTLTESPLPIETIQAPTEVSTEEATESPTQTELTPTETETNTPTPTEDTLPTEAPLTLLVSDTFDSGALYLWTLGDGWMLVPSEGGQALSETNSTEGVTFIYGNLFNIAAQGRFSFSAGSASIAIRQSVAGSYTASLDTTGNVILYRGDTPFATTIVELTPEVQWHTLRLSAIDNVLRVSIDGIEIIAKRDTAPLPPGTVSFGANDEGGLLVDDVTLWSLNETLPPSLTPTLESSPTATATLSPSGDLIEAGTKVEKTTIPNLSSDLSDIYKSWQTGQPETFGEEIRGNQIRIMVIASDAASVNSVVEKIGALGGEVATQFEVWIDAWLPIASLEQLAVSPGVSFVRSPILVAPLPEDMKVPIGDSTVASSATEPMPGSMSSNIPDTYSVVPMNISAAAVSATINTITRDRCIVTVTFTVGSAAKYDFEIWDDHVLIYTKPFNATTGQRITTQYTITQPVGQLAIGYGFIIRNGGTVLAVVDPYDIPADAHQYCANHTISQGVTASGAKAWQTEGWIGSGIKVAVLDHFKGYTLSQQRGELPHNITTYGAIDTTSTEHGTAVAEIIFDMAPGADFTFATPQNAVEMASDIVALAQAGNRIISSSMGFYNAESGDGTGIIANAVAQARAQGAVFIQAAGNQANYNWQGGFTDADNDQFHEFAPGVEVNVLNNGSNLLVGQQIYLYLRWNSWPTTDQDYDLYLVRWTGTQWARVSTSVTSQTGGQPPVEEIRYAVQTAGKYGVEIYAWDADGSQILDLMGHNAPNFKNNMKDRSLVDPAAPALSFSAAAVNVIAPYVLESYSSQGPTLGEGGSLGSGGAQPRIAGYDNVDTWIWQNYHNGRFTGTSAAAPHVAGAMAVVLSAYPDMSPNDVVTYLESHAIDMGAPGYDYVYGTGRLWLGTAPKILAPVITSPIVTITNDNTPTFSWYPVTFGKTYELQIATDSAFRYLVQLQTHLATTVYTSPVLTDGNYYWRVRALNSADFGGPWTSKTLTVDTIAPPTPLLLAPLDKAGVNNTKPTVSWGASTTATTYHLQISMSNTFASTVVDTTTPARSFTVPTQQPFGRYYWRVQARDAAGNLSTWSVVRSFDITIMRSPSNGSWTTNAKPVFAWYAIPGALGYEFQLATASDFSAGNLVINFASLSNLSQTPANPLAYGIYYWRVNIDLGSGFVQSPVYWVLTVTPPPLRAPILQTPATTPLADNTPTFTWVAVPDTNSVSYEIQIARTSAFNPILQDQVVTGTNYIASVLVDGTYYWRVRTLNYLSIPGVWSAARTFVIDTTVPNVPVLIAPPYGSTTTLTKPVFRWGTVPGAVRYELQIGTTTWFTVSNSAATTFTPLSPLLVGKTYYWHVRAFDVAGNASAWSSQWYFYISSLLTDTPVLNRFTTTTPMLTWTKVTWATGYEIQIDNDTGFVPPVYTATIDGGDNLQYTSPILQSGTWYWRIRAVSGPSGSIKGPWTATRRFTVDN